VSGTFYALRFKHLLDQVDQGFRDDVMADIDRLSWQPRVAVQRASRAESCEFIHRL